MIKVGSSTLLAVVAAGVSTVSVAQPAPTPVAKPVVAKPVIAKPVAAKPVASKPVTAATGVPAPDALGPLPTATEPPPPSPPPPPPAVWTLADVQALQTAIAGIGSEGLNPGDYDPAGLRQVVAGGDAVAISAAATDRFNKLSSDLALGHVRGDNRIDWHVIDRDLNSKAQHTLLDQALATNSIATALTGLLPTHPQYGALRAVLAATPKTDTATINRIRLNMDRWRWLPRDLGQKYIIVNVPSFHATLVEDGVTRWKHKAIAGAIKTPTPNLSVLATGVIINPSWEVPPSIYKEVAGKPGFVAIKDKNGKFQRWSQPPGPSNALGQLKFVMYNPYNIYLHDTNARSRFNSQVRALSHGCVRTENVVDLAQELLGDDGGEWTPEKIAEQIVSKKTKQANFVKPVPVYIVYFSAAALVDGTITSYPDLYKRDGKVIAALLAKSGGAPAAAAADKAAKSKL